MEKPVAPTTLADVWLEPQIGVNTPVSDHEKLDALRASTSLMSGGVTGPFEVLDVLKGPPNSFGYYPNWDYTHRVWYRQQRPYTDPLPFSLRRVRITSWASSDPSRYTSVETLGQWAFVQSLSDSAYNSAYENIKSKLSSSSADLAVGLAERKQALTMMADRLTQIGRFARALKRFDFPAAGQELGYNLIRLPTKEGYFRYRTANQKARADGRFRELRFKRTAKAFGDNYLEFHFGWSPLVGDIGNAVNVLQGPVTPTAVKAGGSRRGTRRNGDGYNSALRIDVDKLDVRLACHVLVNNPNLWLANRLGFVNPVAVAWELVPFSFVVDWFANVGDFLTSFSDFWGLSISKVRITKFQATSTSESYQVGSPWGFTAAAYSVLVSRDTPGSFPGPVLRVRDPWVLSPRRGLAAASLLLQKLRT